MPVAPAMKARTPAQVHRRIAMAGANSLLCDIGGRQIPTDGSSMRCVKPYSNTGRRSLLVLSAFSIFVYQPMWTHVVEDGKFKEQTSD